MFALSIVLLVISVGAALLGFTEFSNNSVGITREVFVVCLVLSIASMVVYWRRSSSRVTDLPG
ncbi:MAG TPA: DUF1328 domain-containing protein [Kofleriaceae bacterium]|nr:DUF1328 domain-containing protein [Kofleriaceae bacterium]